MPGQNLNGLLAVSGGIADVIRAGAGDIAEPRCDRGDNGCCIAHRKGGLQGIGNGSVRGEVERRKIRWSRNDRDRSRRDLAQGPNYFRMTQVADQQDVPTGPIPVFDLGMNFGDERTDSVHDPKVAVLGG